MIGPAGVDRLRSPAARLAGTGLPVSGLTATGSGRAGNGWQLLLTDLSLILFMVTAGTLAQTVRQQRVAVTAATQGNVAALPRAAGPHPRGPAPNDQATPLALYRDASGAPSLARWLAAQDPDARQQLTIVAQYRPGGQAAALADATARLREVGAAGGRARVIVEPGPGPTAVTLAFDAAPASPASVAGTAAGPAVSGPGAQLARGLQRTAPFASAKDQP